MTEPPTAVSIDSLLSQLTLDEKVELCSGVGDWHTASLPRLGVPGMKLTDGPSGARGEGVRSVSFAGHRSACFPCGTALGATWDPALVTRVGAALGEEAISKGAHLLLGPTMNLHRSPLAGRNFECFSEDPHLTGVLAAAYVEGVQSRGVGATTKHLVGNESEYQRHTLSTVVDTRTLHEVYLRPFHMVVTTAAPAAIMTAYNRINGVPASDHEEIITDIVKGEWGFDGLLVSDWGGTRSTVPAANAGLDLEMPGPPRYFGAQLVEAVRRGDVREATVDDKVRRVLRTLERTGAWQRRSTEERTVDDPEHRAVARAAAAASMVLLQNPRALIPLDPSRPRTIAVIGPNADRAIGQGGGSAQVAPHDLRNPLEAIRGRVGHDTQVIHEPGCRISRRVPDLDLKLVRPPGAPADATGSMHVEYFDRDVDLLTPLASRTVDRARFLWPPATPPSAEPTGPRARFSATFRAPTAGPWTFALVVAGRARLLLDDTLVIDAGSDRAAGPDFFLDPDNQATATVTLEADVDHELCVEFTSLDAADVSGLSIGALEPQPPDLMERAEQAAAAADTVVLVVGMDEECETEGRDRDRFELPGRQPELIERVTRANRDTVVVMNAGSPVDLAPVPGSAGLLQIWYPGQEGAEALAAVLFGELAPGGRLPTTFPRHLRDTASYGNYPGEFGEVRYGEGLLVGHRWYDTRRIDPAFPFGFGLTTTTMEWTDVACRGSFHHDDLEITTTVTNTGERPGPEVVQVYAHFPEATVSRPEQQLVGFHKVHLEPGESTDVTIPVRAAGIMYRNPVEGRWEVDAGTVELRVGRHSRDHAAVLRVRTRQVAVRAASCVV